MYVHDYASAELWISKGRNAGYRKLERKSNVWAVRTERGFGIKLYNTVVVEYLPDGTFVLNSGGWRTVTTKAEITNHSPACVWSTKGKWAIYHKDDPRTPPKIWKCRGCKGTGTTHNPCSGKQRRYEWHDSFSIGPSYIDGPCRHGCTEYHVVDSECYQCKGSGRYDYGSKGIPTPFVDGIMVNADGKVVGVTSLPVSNTYTPKPKPSGGFVEKHFATPPPAHQVDGQIVMEALRAAVPALRDHVVCPCSCGKTAAMSNVIIHLNDQTRWTREQIADWLDTLDADLAFAIPSEGR